MKASDVYKETESAFTRRGSFGEVFPDIKEASVTVEQAKYGRDSPVSRQYSKDTLSEFVDCTNPICYNGGISIGNILRKMVKEGQTHFEGGQLCQGYEGSPKGRRKYNRCPVYFKVNITIEYKEDLKKE
jgi:hypothetical protein